MDEDQDEQGPGILGVGVVFQLLYELGDVIVVGGVLVGFLGDGGLGGTLEEGGELGGEGGGGGAEDGRARDGEESCVGGDGGGCDFGCVSDGSIGEVHMVSETGV